ncbi:hypothetical protein Tco_1178007, partial [Tanacetum coccineum]
NIVDVSSYDELKEALSHGKWTKRSMVGSNIFPHEEMSIRVLLAKERILKLIHVWDEKQIKPWSLPELLLQLSNDSQTIIEILKQREEKRIKHEQAANLAVQKEQEEQAAQSFTPYWNFPIIDDEYIIQYREYLERSSKAITPDLPTKEPDNSLSMGDEHLDTIPETESDEVIKSSVEDLVPIQSESEGIFNMCDVPSCDKKHFDAESDLMESFLSRDTSITSPKIDFFPRSLPMTLILKTIGVVEESTSTILELVSLEEVNDVDQEKEEIDLEDILRIPRHLSDHKEESSSDIKVPTTWLITSSEFLIRSCMEIEPDQGELTNVVMETILGEPRVHMLNILPTQPILDSDFTPSDDSLGSGLEVSFPSGSRNKIFDPGIFIEVQSFVIRTFLPFLTYPEDSSFPFSFGSEDIIFNPGISAFHFSSLNPVAFKCLMEVCFSTCFIPNITMISGESS